MKTEKHGRGRMGPFFSNGPEEGLQVTEGEFLGSKGRREDFSRVNKTDVSRGGGHRKT